MNIYIYISIRFARILKTRDLMRPLALIKAKLYGYLALFRSVQNMPDVMKIMTCFEVLVSSCYHLLDFGIIVLSRNLSVTLG